MYALLGKPIFEILEQYFTKRLPGLYKVQDKLDNRTEYIVHTDPLFNRITVAEVRDGKEIACLAFDKMSLCQLVHYFIRR